MPTKSTLFIALCLFTTTAAAGASPVGWYKCISHDGKFAALGHVVQGKAPHRYNATWYETYANKAATPHYSDVSKWFIRGNKGISSFAGQIIQTGDAITGTSILRFNANSLSIEKLHVYALSKNGKIRAFTGGLTCKKTKNPPSHKTS
jgi:hypothetical protein